MRYVTSVERLAIQQGKQKGAAAAHSTLACQTRFGPLNAETLTGLQTATLEQLERWAETLLDAAKLDVVFKDNRVSHEISLAGQWAHKAGNRHCVDGNIG
jgi:hypothetical protein